MENEEQKGLNKFIDCLIAAIHEGGLSNNDSAIKAGELIAGLRGTGNPNSMVPGGGMPALEYLPKAIKNAGSGPIVIRDLVTCFEKIVDRLPWYRRSEPALPDFMRGHANAFIIGPNGLEKRGKLVVGTSLLAPKVEYPPHNHLPNELYVAMSSGDWRQDNGPWQTPGIGGLIYNSSNVIHSMRSNSEPLLAIWCLWISSIET